MKTLKCSIKIGRYVFDYVVDIVIKSDIDALTDTCSITLPRKLSWEGKNITLGQGGLIKTGNKVTVKAGYDSAQDTIFTGYVRRIRSGVRITIECENEIFHLKNNALTRSYKTVTLGGLLADIVPQGTKVRSAAISLGQLRISKSTPAQVLEHLKDNYGIYSYFKSEVLYSGLAYWPDTAAENIFHFQRNIARDGHPEFVNADDVKLKVMAISIQDDNTKLEVETGDPDGEERTLYFYNVKQADLKAVADEELKKYKYNGLRGHFTAFGEPLTLKGDIVTLKDDVTPEREGSYYVKAVEIRFGSKGYRQLIELGPKL